MVGLFGGVWTGRVSEIPIDIEQGRVAEILFARRVLAADDEMRRESVRGRERQRRG